MSIKGVLREELANSLRMKAGYERELASLPKGSLARRRINGHVYYYLIYREAGKVHSVYRGKVSNAELKKYRDAKEYRVRYRRLLSRAKKQILFLKGALRGKEPI